MNASKETAKLALESLVVVSDKIPPHERTQVSFHLIRIEEFLLAAEKKLPRESSYAKEKTRGKK